MRASADGSLSPKFDSAEHGRSETFPWFTWPTHPSPIAMSSSTRSAITALKSAQPRRPAGCGGSGDI